MLEEVELKGKNKIFKRYKFKCHLCKYGTNIKFEEFRNHLNAFHVVFLKLIIMILFRFKNTLFLNCHFKKM